MSRRRSINQDSLDLLLDTICNTFGGVLFIAILVVLLLQQTGKGPTAPDASRPISSVNLLNLANQMEAAAADLARLRANMASQEVIAEGFAPVEIRQLLDQRRNLSTQQNEIQDHLDQLRIEQAVTQTRIDEIYKDIEQTRIKHTNAVNRRRKAEETLEKDRLSRVEAVRLPVIRTAASKQEIGIIVRYGRLYVWHNYGPSNERLGLNTSEMVIVSEDREGIVTRPNPTKGVALDGSPESRESIRQRLRRFDSKTCYLVFVVRPDSFGAFRYVRDEAIALGFEYRLMPAEDGSPIVDRGGTGGKVQ